MKGVKTVLLVFFISLCFSRISAYDLAICDNSELNPSGTTYDEVCNGGNKLNNINGLGSFTGAYTDLGVGNIGNNFTYSNSLEDKGNFSPNGFLGTNFLGMTVYDKQDNNPIGYFGSYIGTSLSYENNSYKYFSPGEKVVFGEIISDNNSSSNSQVNQTCKQVNKTEDISIEIQTGKNKDYLELSWEENSDKIKIIQISPQYKEYYIGSGNNYVNTDLIPGDNYSYFVVSYNDCGNFSYSDLVSLKYEKIITNPYLELNNNSIYLKNFDSIIGNNPKLYCTYIQDEFINKDFDSTYVFQIPERYIDLPFSCYGEYFSNSKNKLEKTDTYINNIIDQITLTNSKAIEILTQTKDSKLYFEEKLYYLYKDVVLKEDLTYYSLALLALNLDGGLIIEDKDLALKIAKDLGTIKSDVSGSLIVEYDDFINTLSKIKSDNGYKINVLTSLEKNFNLSRYQIFLDLEKIYYINLELDKLSNYQKEILISCYQFTGCTNYKLYKSFDEKVYSIINQNKYKYLGININDSTVNWNEYVKLIYKVFSKNGFYNGKYSFSELDHFIDILLDAVFYEQEFGDKKLDYFSYNRLNISLVSSRLSLELDKLIGFYNEINIIYENINDKSKLFSLLKTYLN